MRLTSLAALCGLLCTHPSQAAVAPSADLEEVVVTASRIRQPLIQTIQHSTVITEQEIRASLAADLPTLLRQQAGIEITQTGGMGSQSSLFLRGAESDHTLVLLDGMRIASATTGMTALDQIMSEDIDRIEIVRGNVSALYGSEAIGGVIQIFTKQGKGTPGGSIRAGLGSYGGRAAAAGYGGESGRTRYYLGLSRRDSDGFSAARREFIPAPFVFAPGDTDRDGYRNTTLTLNLAHDFSPGYTLSFSGRASRGRVEYDGAFQNRSEQDLEAYSLRSENALGEHWLSRLAIGQSRDVLDNFLDATATGFVHTRNRQAEWFNTFTLLPGQTVTLGLGVLQQRVSSDQPYSRTGRLVRHAALGYVGESGRHGVQLNVRRDDYSDFGGHTTGLAGYTFALSPAWRLVASAGSAFRAPSFNDLYNAAWGGNPGLRPEKTRSWEAGVQYGAARLNGRLVHFSNRTKDLIVYQWPAGLVNLSKARSDGWEGSLGGRLADFDLKLSLTWQDPRDEATGQPLLRRAQRLGSLSASRSLGNWDLTAEVKASSSRPDIHVTDYSRITVPGYAVVNLSGRYRLSRDVNLEARIDNLFDRDYSLVHGYNTAGRSAFVQLDWRF